MIVRWKFHDTETDETVFLPINPNEADGAEIPRNMSWAWGTARKLSYAYQDRPRGINRPASAPPDWTFSGVIRDEAHHDLLLDWAQRSSILRVTDHFERTFEIIISEFDFTERQPTRDRPWRGTYTMTCLLLKEIT